nr:MAG TPA: hypothetical protein [Caudoviricetes sp.]
MFPFLIVVIVKLLQSAKVQKYLNYSYNFFI